MKHTEHSSEADRTTEVKPMVTDHHRLIYPNPRQCESSVTVRTQCDSTKTLRQCEYSAKTVRLQRKQLYQ